MSETDTLKQALIKITDIDLGVYPQSFQGKYEERTEWMEGWNACVMKHIEAIGSVLLALGIHIDSENNITIIRTEAEKQAELEEFYRDNPTVKRFVEELDREFVKGEE